MIKFFSFFGFLVVMIAFVTNYTGYITNYDYFNKNSDLANYNQWKQFYNITSISTEHNDNMYQNWLNNDRLIKETNAQNLSYTLAHNEFSHMNLSEFINNMNLNNNDKLMKKKLEAKSTKSIKSSLLKKQIESIPKSVDWRLISKNVVSPVKNQGKCGSCWSFSATGALEGAYGIKYNKSISFSEQQLIDCNKANYGCDGGFVEYAFDWIKSNKGLCKESDYKYVSENTKTSSTCKKTCTKFKNATISSYINVVPNSDLDLMYAVSKQPVSVAIESASESFMLYKSGILTAKCGTNLDHAVLLIGYGSSIEGDYYIIKNSWGKSWGENGYIRLGRNSSYNNGAGQCGILMEPIYPKLA